MPADRYPPPDSASDRAPAAGFVEFIAVAAVLAIVAVVTAAISAGPAPSPAGVAGLGIDTVDLCAGVDDGYLSGRLYGAIARRIEWRGTAMSCEGGPRPGGDGVRLVFAAPPSRASARLVFVIGISGALDGLAGAERAANITLIDESAGRFFSSGRQERCWTKINSVGGDHARVRVSGDLYCTGSLPSLSDGSSVTLGDFRFSGLLVGDES